MLTINGDAGEGGGQILRTSLTLALVTGRPFRIEGIRAGRKRPGLLRQHLAAVHAAAELSDARVEGAELRSTSLVFEPRALRAGTFHGAIGSAGSACLVLQTLLPALLCAPGPCEVVLEGGTHNPLAPTCDFLERTFLPLLARMGARVELALERPGFYPAGGGRIVARTARCGELAPFELLECGAPGARSARILLAHLPRAIADREIAVIERRLGWALEQCTIEERPDSTGPGNVVALEIASEHACEVITAFGAIGVSAEAVATHAVDEARAYLACGAPVGVHLADQLLLPLAIAGGGAFRTQRLSTHATTNAEVIAQFLPIETRTTPGPRESVVVEIVARRELTPARAAPATG
jgi:RNA 3'-terminal phosphate cyclase (ATP)